MINQIEHRYNRALKYCISKLKFFSVFFILFISSFVLIFFNYLSNQLDEKMVVSLAFIAVLFLFGVLLSMGVFLIRVYYHEVKQLKIHFLKILQDSWQMMIKAFYICVPVIFVCLSLWLVLFLFSFLSQIPSIGSLFVFGPYLLLFLALMLLMCNIIFLFFITPIIALSKNEKFISESLKRMKYNYFYNMVSFIIAVIPLGVILGFLYLAKVLSQVFEISPVDPFSLAVRSVFIFAPVCAIITPFVIFFFNFAAEMYQLYKKS